MTTQPTSELGWLALGVVSVTMLVLALFLPDELALALAAVGFAGLVAFLVTASWMGWVPLRRGTAHADNRSDGSAPQRESTPQGVAWRSNSIRGRPPRWPLGDHP